MRSVRFCYSSECACDYNRHIIGLASSRIFIHRREESRGRYRQHIEFCFDAHPADLLRELAPQILGAVVRRFHDFAAARGCIQEALLAANMQWPSEGVPDNSRGWLIQVATRRMMNYFRSERGGAGKLK